jgi:hypothetical protein
MTISELFSKSPIAELWDSTEAATDYTPIPSGTYEMEAVRGKRFDSKQGTPGYKITWRVKDGELEGRLVWQDLWLTKAALPMTKRDLAKLGIQSGEQLDKPLADGIVAKVQLVRKAADSGTEYNEVKRFDGVRVESDPFSPMDGPDTLPPDESGKVQDESDKMQATSVEADTQAAPPPEAGTAVADYVKAVADKIAVGNAVSRATLSKQLAPMSEARITEALKQLTPLGLHSLVVDANYAYFWTAKPTLTAIAVEPELSAEQFLTELEGGTYDA